MSEEELTVYFLEDVVLAFDKEKRFSIVYNDKGHCYREILNGHSILGNMLTDIKRDSNEKIQIFSEDMCPLTYLWTQNNYAHFLLEIISKVLVMEKLGYTGKYICFWQPYIEELLRIIGILPERITWTENLPERMQLKRCFLMEGLSLGKEKTLRPLLRYCDSVKNEYTDNTYPRYIYM